MGGDADDESRQTISAAQLLSMGSCSAEEIGHIRLVVSWGNAFPAGTNGLSKMLEKGLERRSGDLSEFDPRSRDYLRCFGVDGTEVLEGPLCQRLLVALLRELIIASSTLAAIGRGQVDGRCCLVAERGLIGCRRGM